MQFHVFDAQCKECKACRYMCDRPVVPYLMYLPVSGDMQTNTCRGG